MRTFELRVYSLRTQEALDFYREVVYPRHLNSFPLFGIEAHGFWMPRRMSSHGVSCWSRGGRRTREVGRRYMQSTEFADDTRDFGVADIVGVESTILIPSTSSPLA